MLFAHAPFSVLMNEYIQKKKLNKIDYRHIPHIITISLLSGILPDFDFFILAAQSKPAYLHHNLITHTPILWIVTAVLLRFFLLLIRNYLSKRNKEFISAEFINVISLSFLIGTLSHILADLPLGFIMLFYPLSKYAFTIFGDVLVVNPMVNYLTHPFIFFEIFIVLAFGYFILNKHFDLNKKILKRLFVLGSGVLTILFSISMYFYLNTYIPDVRKDAHNNYNFDIDGDYLIDLLDRDINNNNRDNLQDINRQKIAEIAKKIAISNKLATTNSDTQLERFGVLTPYGLISTVYFESNKTLEPVIKQHLINEKKDVKYNMNAYLKVLADRESIEQFDLNSKRDLTGYTLFILDNKNNVVNAGIFTVGMFNEKNDELIIISPFDKRMTAHSITEIQEIYETSKFKYLIEK